MRRLRVGLVVAGFALAALPVLAEDLTIVSKETSGNAPEKTTSQYFTKERMRNNSGDHDMIFEYGTGKITNIDHKKKEYSEITLAELGREVLKLFLVGCPAVFGCHQQHARLWFLRQDAES